MPVTSRGDEITEDNWLQQRQGNSSREITVTTACETSR